MQVYIIFICDFNTPRITEFDSSTRHHCISLFSSTWNQIALYFGLATSWLSISKNLVRFEENNYEKEGQQFNWKIKLFLFLKHVIGSGTRIASLTIYWHGLFFKGKWRYSSGGFASFFIAFCLCPVLVHFVILGLFRFCYEKFYGILNWKELIKWSFLGILGSFSDSSKRLSVKRIQRLTVLILNF